MCCSSYHTPWRSGSYKRQTRRQRLRRWLRWWVIGF